MNTQMYVGEDKTIVDTIFKSDKTTKKDITGWSVKFTLHEINNPSNVYFTKDTMDGISLTNPTQGELTITIDRADTVDLTPKVYQLLVERTDTGFSTVLTKTELKLMER